MSSNLKPPKYGDTVYVRDGNWLGGIVNSVKDNGEMLIGVVGHSKNANAVLVNLNDYLVSWCYPGDVDRKSLESIQKRI